MTHWPRTHAFVLQLPSEFDLRAGSFEGRLEHVVSGRVSHFSSLDELRDFINDVMTEVLRGIRDSPESIAKDKRNGD